ncbi:MAG: DMP19 family protein, partial [Hyphomicrobiales bacterium]
TSEYSDLSRAQRPAHLVFWYDSEVQSGGHLQYFLNRGIEHTQETIDALRQLNADLHAGLLEKAAALWNSRTREQPRDVYDYADAARLGEFDELDNAFYSAIVDLAEVLETHLAENEGSFIVRE